MSQEGINRAARRAKRRRVLGDDARCERCGWSELPGLTMAGSRVLCYECRCAEIGKTTTEEHHHMGQANDPTTIPLPGNLHRSLSDDQYGCPAELTHNPDRDPVIWLAQACRGLGDHLAWWAKMLPRIATWLVELAAALRRTHGVEWWVTLGVQPFWEVMMG